MSTETTETTEPTETPAKKKVSPRDLGEPCGATTRTGTACSNPSMPGIGRCHQHGGAQASAVAKSERARVGMELEKYATPLPKDHPLASPIESLLEEHRRCQGRIAWLDSRIAELQEKDLQWSKAEAEVEDIGASETPGRNKRVRYEARVHQLVELQMQERRHGLSVAKLIFDTGFESARMQMHAGARKATIDVLLGAFENIGLDPKSDEVKAAIRRSILDHQQYRVPALDK